MKKIILSSLMAAAAAVPALAGVDNINYQAVIKNGNNVVSSKAVEMKFELLDKAENVVYTEDQTATTNAAGYVSCQLGGEALSTIEWGDLTLRVSINLGNGYEVISNEAVSSVPTALYALRSADSDEIKAAVEELMIENESNKTSILGINAELVKFDGFIEDVENFNNDLSEKLEPMMGLNYEEINEFHERVSDRLVVLSESNDEIVEAVEGLVKENEDIKANLKDLGADAAQIEGLAQKVENVEGTLKTIIQGEDGEEGMFVQIGNALGEIGETVEGLVKENEDIKANLRDLGADVAQIEGLAQELDELNNNTDAFATMVEGRFDKVEKGLADTDTAIEQLTEQTDAFATMVENRIDKLQGEVATLDNDFENLGENLNNVGTIARANEQAIDELNTNTEAFATSVETRFDKVEKELSDAQNDLANLGENFEKVGEIVRANETAVNELNTNTEAFAEMVETRMDKVEKELADTDNDIENVKENLTNAFTAVNAEIAEINGQIENLNQVAAVARANEEAIEQLNTNTEAFAGLTENRIDRLQKDIEIVSDEVQVLKDTLDQLIQALKDLDVLPTAFSAGK